MNDAYRQLLEATVAHLEILRDQGVTHVPVRQETLRTLVAPLNRRPAATTAPASTPVSRLAPGAMTARAPLAPAPQLPPPPFEALDEPKAPPVVPTKPSAAAAARWAQAAAPADAARKAAVVPDGKEAAKPLPPPLSREEKEAAMAELRTKALACVKCPHLVASRKSVVFGVGDIHSPLMFVGEAPGADEDERGEPFVGKAGELLTKIIAAMGLSRDQVYIANILKCRPDTPGQSFGNRKPRPEEMSTCTPWLQSQIDIIQPRVMVALGATAVEGLLGMASAGITRLRGNWQQFRGIPLMPTYHPSYVIRNGDMATKRQIWEDMLKVMEKLPLPISEKQRGFFLKQG